MTTTCSHCDGSGLLLTTDDRGNRFAHECQCRLALRVERALTQSRIPRRYSECSLLNYETAHSSAHPSLAEAALIARRFALAFPVETRGQGLLFTGAPGLGKTHLATGILRQAITERGATGYFWEHKELLEKLRSFYDLRSAGAEDKLLRSVITCDLLVLDDLGEMTPSEWVFDTTAYILNSRYNENRSTLITTNRINAPALVMAPGEEESGLREARELRNASKRFSLGDSIGDRMLSRLQEMCKIVEVVGHDFRYNVKRASFS